jgi:hypothetical protein
MASHLQITGNNIVGGAYTTQNGFTPTAGDKAPKLTFGATTISVVGDLQVSQLDVTTVKQFAGNAITLTKSTDPSAKSFYGSKDVALDEIATLFVGDSLQTRFSIADYSLQSRISTADDSLQTRFSTADDSLQTRSEERRVGKGVL